MGKDTSLKRKVYNGIIDLIATKEISPGSIITEKSIIERFNYSRSPVREAMLELCKDGILKNLPRYGYQVTEMSNKTLMEIVEVRLILEVGNYRNIAEKIPNDLIASTFEDVEEKLKIQDKEVWEAENNNENFHLNLIDLSGNRILHNILKKLLNMYSRAYAQMYIAIPSRIAPKENHNHKLFLDAWKNRDYKKAEEYLRNDILTSIHEIQYVKY